MCFDVSSIVCFVRDMKVWLTVLENGNGNLEGSKFHDHLGLDDALRPLAVTQHPSRPTTLARPPVSLDSFPISTLSFLSSKHHKPPIIKRKEQHANKEFIACVHSRFQGRRPHI